jgi:hypothetical protein
MIIHLLRDTFTADATLGLLSIDYGDGRGLLSFGTSCEDEDRGLSQGMSEADIRARKVSSETAIPVGEYVVRWTYSPKYAARMQQWAAIDYPWNPAALRRLQAGKMPLLENVPGFAGIRIHVGNDDDDTAGCILPGLRRDKVQMVVTSSTKATRWLYNELARCEEAGTNRMIIERDAAAWAAFCGRG